MQEESMDMEGVVTNSNGHHGTTDSNGVGNGAPQYTEDINKPSNVVDFKIDEELIPVTITYCVNNEHGESVQVSDSFTWNLYEPSLTPEAFAEVLAYDLNLSDDQYYSIVSQIKKQMECYIAAAATIRSSPWLQNNEPTEHIVNIKIDVTINNLRFKDQFQWNVFDESSNPETFARSVVLDTGLPLYFVSPIATNIRQQIHTAKLNYYMKQFQQFKKNIPLSQPTPISSAFRSAVLDELKRWGPRIIKTTNTTNNTNASSSSYTEGKLTRSRRRARPQWGSPSLEDDELLSDSDEEKPKPPPKPKKEPRYFHPRTAKGRFMSKEEMIAAGLYPIPNTSVASDKPPNSNNENTNNDNASNTNDASSTTESNASDTSDKSEENK